MTPIELLNGLKREIEDITKNIMLEVKETRATPQEDRAPKVYVMDLPRKEDEIQQIPYILLKYVTSKDEQPPGQMRESKATIRIIIAVYSKNAGEGQIALLNIMTQIRMFLLKKMEINNQFNLILPLDTIIYQDNTRPYFLGEMLTNWTMPTIEREWKK